MSINVLALAKRVREERRGGESPRSLPREPENSSSAAFVACTRSTTCEVPKRAGDTDALLARAAAINLRGEDQLGELLQLKPVGPLPTVYYVNSIISNEDATALIAAIDAEDQWIDLKRRRLQRRGGEVTPSGLQKAEPLPPYLAALSAALVRLGVFPPHLAPNHVLINEYLGGQGILPHTDGPAYHPCVTTISLGCDALMHFTAPRGGSVGGDGRYLQQLVLRKNSLVVFTDDAYKNVLHAIADAYEEVVGADGPCVNLEASAASDGEVLERTRRVSITIRHVPLAPVDGPTALTT